MMAVGSKGVRKVPSLFLARRKPVLTSKLLRQFPARFSKVAAMSSRPMALAMRAMVQSS
ncbi:hypothetical protein D3C86_2191730 [compost metagenome]